MISVKSDKQVKLMRAAARVAASALSAGGRLVRPGVTTAEIDREILKIIREAGARPSFLGYNGFPNAACISINNEVIHGIPGARRVKNGDIVSIDVGAMLDGFHGDCAATFTAGEISGEAKRLIEVTRESFYRGLRYARGGCRVTDISFAIQKHVEENGFSVVRKYVGHGVGASLHEDPEIPNFGSPGKGARLCPGMTLAIEPMVNAGGFDVTVASDRWTVVTADGSLSAHYENTVLITDGEPEILTADCGDSAYG